MLSFTPVGHPCDERGEFLPDSALPPPLHEKPNNDWSPYRNHLEFKLADFLYTRNQMPAAQINSLLDIWAASLLEASGEPLFIDHKDLYKTMNSTTLGEVKWESFSIQYTNFASGMDYRPYCEYEAETDKCHQHNFMSTDWAWKQADIIARDPATHGSTLVPVILGSDKTTISVVTGQNDFYPLYLPIGNVHNNIRHAHKNALVLVGFLAIPKNYEEQVLLSCIVRDDLGGNALYRCREHMDMLIESFGLSQLWEEYGIVGQLPFTNDFPSTDIHQLLSPDLLHQIIKGAFKDHLVDWVERYLKAEHGPAEAKTILDNIDRRIAVVAPFAGRHFKQWTGNDSKALMKVYIPTIEGHVPQNIVRVFCAFLEFCYLVQCDIITDDMLTTIDNALEHFHWYCETFCTKILLSNQFQVDFRDCGMLNGSCVSTVLRALGMSHASVTKYKLNHIYEYENLDDSHHTNDIPLSKCPCYNGKILVFNSASATFFAPSDFSGISGMRQEYIHSCHTWRHGQPRYDFVHWFICSEEPNETTGMWIIRPGFNARNQPDISIIHLDTVYRAAHLILIYGAQNIPPDIQPHQLYDIFRAYYINKFADHHAFEIVSQTI
ncbi:hypothetical protein BDN67DRAFT_992647 [Paxillus ammoniavirescens]|nr:hypothetical protein BDN67DRAFT_992647 [Paxillus ammoniavirescens]